jgi:hypothetical protein
MNEKKANAKEYKEDSIDREIKKIENELNPPA